MLLILVVVGLSTSRADEICRPKGVSVYFGNGMFNSYDDAEESLAQLENLHPDLGEPEDKIEYKLAFNESGNATAHLLTVFRQKIGNNLKQFWLMMAQHADIPEPILDAMASVMVSDRFDSSNRTKMMQDYNQDILDLRKILLVSHSQGNFYAEEVISRYKAVFSKQQPNGFGFGNVRVATPTLSRFDFPWFTFADDQIINFVRRVGNAPDPNLLTSGRGLSPGGDPAGHNFIRSYLASEESRNKIRAAMSEQVRKTAYPTQASLGLSAHVIFDDIVPFKFYLVMPFGKRDRMGSFDNESGFGIDEMCNELHEGVYSVEIDSSEVARAHCMLYDCTVHIGLQLGKQQAKGVVKFAADGDASKASVGGTLSVMSFQLSRNERGGFNVSELKVDQK